MYLEECGDCGSSTSLVHHLTLVLPTVTQLHAIYPELTVDLLPPLITMFCHLFYAIKTQIMTWKILPFSG